MSQAGFSTISSNDAQQIKYKKALREISKLIQSNRKLREENDIHKRTLQKQIQRLENKCQSAAAQAQIIRNEKEQLIRENQLLREQLKSFERQNQSLEKQLKYVNQMLMDQKNYLKKYEMFQNQQKIGKILKTYEDMQEKHKNQVDVLHQQIKTLNIAIQQKMKEAKTANEQKAETDKKYQLLNEQIQKYKVLNLHLINQHQKIFNDENARRKFTEKEQQINNLILSLKNNIQKITEFNMQKSNKKSSWSEYELNLSHITQEKLQLQAENKKLQKLTIQLQEKLKKTYQQEQKLLQYQQKIFKLSEQCNMLKSKIIVLEVKNQELEEDQDFIQETKEMEEKIQHIIAIGDPLQAIKNSDDTSHFRVLKNCIQTLRCKLQLSQSKKRQIQKKYKILHAKYSKIHKGWENHTSQVSLLKAKIEGYQRLSQKLQRQLQKNIIIHQNHIKQLQFRNRQQFRKKSSQVELSLNKYRRDYQTVQDKNTQHEKSLKRQLQILKQRLSSESIKCENVLNMLKKNQEFIELSKKRQAQMIKQLQELKKDNIQIREECEKYKKSFTEEKMRNQQLIKLKAEIQADYERIAKRLNDRQLTSQEMFKVREEQYQLEIRKLKTQILKLSQQKEFFEKSATSSKRQYEQYRKNFDFDLQQLTKQTQRNAKLQEQFNKLKSTYQEILDQNDLLKIKMNRYSEDHQKVYVNEKQKANKDDEIDELKIKVRSWENKYNSLEAQLNNEKKNNETLRKQVNSLHLAQSQHSQHQKSTSTMQSQLKEQRQRNSKLMSQIESINQQLLKIEGSYENLYSSEITQKSVILSLQNQVVFYKTMNTEFQKKNFILQQEINQVEQFFQDIENYVSYLNSIIQGPEFEGKNFQELRAQDRILQIIKCLRRIKQLVSTELPLRHVKIATSSKFEDEGQVSQLIYHGKDYQILINSGQDQIKQFKKLQKIKPYGQQKQ